MPKADTWVSKIRSRLIFPNAVAKSVRSPRKIFHRKAQSSCSPGLSSTLWSHSPTVTTAFVPSSRRWSPSRATTRTYAELLPKSEYQELDNAVLGQLLRTLNPDELKSIGSINARVPYSTKKRKRFAKPSSLDDIRNLTESRRHS